MAAHAALGASTSARWLACPGSLAHMQTFGVEVESTTSVYAAEGTAAHHLLEYCMAKGRRPHDLIDVPFTQLSDDPETHQFTVDEDMADAVLTCMDYVGRRCEELGLMTPADELYDFRKLIKLGIIKQEVRVKATHARDDMWGTSDIILDVWPTFLEVIDYKHGKGVYVPVKGNTQARFYGLGTLQELGGRDYEQVRLTICQPRHPDSGRDGIDFEDMSANELREFEAVLLEGAERVEEAFEVARNSIPSASLMTLYKQGFVDASPGGKHCTFCDLLAQCPAATDVAQELAAIEFGASEPYQPDTSALSLEWLAEALPWVDFLDKWLSAVKAYALQQLELGAEIPGYKLVHGRSIRRWAETLDEKELIAFLVKECGVSEDKFMNHTIKTGPQIEKVIPKEQRKPFNEKFLVKPPGKVSMAPDSDPRPAIPSGFTEEV